MTEQPTRGEFELLRQIVGANQTRLDSIDASGTRGVGIVQAQLADVVKDLAQLRVDMNGDLTDLKTEVNSRFTEVGLRFDGMKTDVDKQFTDHRHVHEQEQRDRTSARRWIIGTGLAGVAAMSTVIGLLVDILRHVH